MSPTREDQHVFFVVEAKFVNMENKVKAAPHAITLDTLLWSSEVVFILV